MLKSSNKATAHWEFFICLLICYFFYFIFTFMFLRFSLASLSNQLFFFWTNTRVLSVYKNPTKLKHRWNKKDAYKERIKATFMVCDYKWIHQMDKNLKWMCCFSSLQSVYDELILDCCLIISTDSIWLTSTKIFKDNSVIYWSKIDKKLYSYVCVCVYCIKI